MEIASGFPFAANDRLEARFRAGLDDMLRRQDAVGAFILALNNALSHPALYRQLRPLLEQRFEALAERRRAAAAANGELDAPPDDRDVFAALLRVGLDGVEPPRHRLAGPWQLQLNRVRAWRPARAAAEHPTGNRAPFDPGRFHFDKPFLRKEAFWEGEIDGMPVELLYNKFPFVPYHGLLIPERTAHRPQWLERHDHALAWRIAEHAGATGFGIAYNSYGAFASVNNLHFQCFVGAEPLPIEDPCWRHLGGTEPYPVCCSVHNDPNAAWHRIDGLQRGGISFNLLYRPGRVYCLPRQRQGMRVLPGWCQGLAWYELCGGFVCTDEVAWEGLAEPDLRALLAASSVSA